METFNVESSIKETPLHGGLRASRQKTKKIVLAKNDCFTSSRIRAVWSLDIRH